MIEVHRALNGIFTSFCKCILSEWGKDFKSNVWVKDDNQWIKNDDRLLHSMKFFEVLFMIKTRNKNVSQDNFSHFQSSNKRYFFQF